MDTNGQIRSNIGHPGKETSNSGTFYENGEEPSITGEILVSRDKNGRVTSGSRLNPNGKPRGRKHFKTMFLETLNNQAKTTQGREIPYDQALVNKLIQLGIQGNLKAIEMIMDRVDGKPKQAVEFDDNGPRTPYVVNDEDRKRVLDLFDIRNQKIEKKPETDDTKSGELKDAYKNPP